MVKKHKRKILKNYKNFQISREEEKDYKTGQITTSRIYIFRGKEKVTNNKFKNVKSAIEFIKDHYNK